MNVSLFTPDDAPEASREQLADVKKKMGGFLPNLYRQMAQSPAVLEAYLTLSRLLGETSFTPAEQQLILMTASARNGCVYCVAAHSSGARMAKLDQDAIAAIRDGTPITDAKLQALRVFTETVLDTRGKVGEAQMAAFTGAGYAETQAIEVLVGISMKALSNSFARMVETPLDDMLAKLAWQGNDRV